MPFIPLRPVADFFSPTSKEKYAQVRLTNNQDVFFKKKKWVIR